LSIGLGIYRSNKERGAEGPWSNKKGRRREEERERREEKGRLL